MAFSSNCTGMTRDMYDKSTQGTQMPGTMPGTMPGMTQMAPMQPMYPAFPSGMPTGPATSGTPATPVMAMTAPPGEQSPQTLASPLYTPGFLKTQIGKRMRVEFLIGTSSMTDRTGTLLGVGASYILLQPIDSDDVMLCDIYSIKFVTIIR